MSKGELSKEVRHGIVERARKMRTEPTPEEEILWESLRKRRLGGFKFRRQHVIAAYIVDFYCPQARLVVEIDGLVHEKQKEYDQEREEVLTARGYRVIRFTNEEINADLDEVLKRILEILGK